MASKKKKTPTRCRQDMAVLPSATGTLFQAHGETITIGVVVSF